MVERSGWRIAIEKHLGFSDRQSQAAGETDYMCPFCKASHLHVNYGKGAALCHGCKRGFKSLRTLLRALGGEVPDFRILDDGQGDLVGMIDELGKRQAGTGEQPVHLPQGFHLIEFPCTSRLELVVANYLQRRQFTKKDIVELGIGYSDDGPLRGYAVFPVRMAGKLVTWTSRRVTGLGSKQLHAKQSHARSALFNYDRCGTSKRLIMCEGPFDAKAVHARVRPSDGGLGLLGTSLSDEKAHAIADLPAEDCIVLLDDDKAGRASASKIAKRLIAVGKTTRIAFPPDGMDPDEMEDDALQELIDSAPIVDELDLVLEGL